MTEPLFPDLVERCDPPAAPCRFPYFLVAYWPRGDYWSIKHPLEGAEIDDTMRAKIRALQESGWMHVTIMRLPVDGPWGAKP